jgi:hypothetical protein
MEHSVPMEVCRITLAIIDAKILARKGTVKAAAHPFGVAIDPQGARAYTVSVENHDVSDVDLEEAKLLGTVEWRINEANGAVVGVSGPETAAGGIDQTTARDHDPAAATPFDRFHLAGTGNDLSRRDLDRAARTLDESDPVVNITDNPVRD